MPLALFRRCFFVACAALGAALAMGCEEPARKKAAPPAVPEACVTLGACCETLPEPDFGTCWQEQSASLGSDTGGVPCSRALATYRGRGFCGGKIDPGKTLAPGCAVLAACCASIEDEGERAACDVDLEAFSASREGEDGCVSTHADRVAAGICEEAPPVPRGPSCEALVDCCASLASDARAACNDSADQLAARASAEDDCAASRAAYEKAGLCLDP